MTGHRSSKSHYRCGENCHVSMYDWCMLPYLTRRVKHLSCINTIWRCLYKQDVPIYGIYLGSQCVLNTWQLCIWKWWYIPCISFIHSCMLPARHWNKNNIISLISYIQYGAVITRSVISYILTINTLMGGLWSVSCELKLWFVICLGQCNAAWDIVLYWIAL